MAKLTITNEKYMNLPVWISDWVFNETLKGLSQSPKTTSVRRLEKMHSHGFVDFKKITISGTHKVEYVVTFDTEENMTKFMMEYM